VKPPPKKKLSVYPPLGIGVADMDRLTKIQDVACVLMEENVVLTEVGMYQCGFVV